MSDLLIEIIGLIADIVIHSASNKRDRGSSYFAETPYKRTTLGSNDSTADSKYTSQAVTYARPSSSQAFGPTFDGDTKGIPYIAPRIREPEIEIKPQKETKPYRPTPVPKTKTVPVSKGISTSFYTKESANGIKLQVLLLYYMFFEDDMRISMKEKSQIKRYFSKYRGTLGEYDIKEIKEFADQRLSIDTIIAYVANRNIVQREVNTAVDMLGIYNSGGRYTNIINFIKRYLVEDNDL
ncbi:hypothetical protein OAO42_01185 [Candidatus Izimaplasma bacterium]|nr:hypothetical protein [Candidatus Izimaplasma bacterium]